MREKRIVTVILTKEELLERGAELATKRIITRQKEDEIKEIKASFKSELDVLEVRMRELDLTLKEEKEQREVEVDIVMHPEIDKKDYVDPYSGEVYDTVDMLPSDYQQNMFEEEESKTPSKFTGIMINHEEN